MDFTKTQCDGCGRPFEKDDNIVVCPVCGTPQHRECYELAGGCVNAAKHELGFEFIPPEEEKAEEKPAENLQNRSRAGEAVNESLAMGELPDVNDVIEQRVNAICPGITEQQRREEICGVEFGLASAFVGNGAAKYINKFRKMEQGGKRTFNWAAFLFAPYWFFWRKLYKQGIFIAAIHICASILQEFFVTPVIPLYEEIMSRAATGEVLTLTDAETSAFFPVGIKLIALSAGMFLLHIFIGFFADRMYHRYCRNSLHEFRSLKTTEENDELLKFFLSKSSTSVIATVIAVVAIYFIPVLIAQLSIFK